MNNLTVVVARHEMVVQCFIPDTTTCYPNAGSALGQRL